MYTESINLLKQKGVEIEKGLSSTEIIMIEKIYGIQFPESLKMFLMEGLPISKGFYNWRNFEQENIRFIKRMIQKPTEDFEEFAEEVDWCDEWGDEPESRLESAKIVRARIKSAPKLLPVYSHRYVPVFSDDPPVFSVHGVDLIHYGENLKEYIEVEFGNKIQNQVKTDSTKYIPFWSDIM